MIPAMTNPPIPDEERPPPGPRDVDVRGRAISVKMLTDAQMMLLGREARLARRPDVDNERRMTAVARLFDILESVIISPEDQEYCVNLAVKGDLELKDLMGFVTAFADDDEEEEPQPKVRRGKAPAKRG